MKFNQTSLMKHFRINKKESLGFILMLTTLKKDEKFKSDIANIKKIEENKFEIITKNSIDNLSKLWVDDSQITGI